LTHATFKPLAKLQIDSTPAALVLLEAELPALELLEAEPELLEDDELALLELPDPALDPVELEPLFMELLAEVSLEPAPAVSELEPLALLAGELVELALLSGAEPADDDDPFELEAWPYSPTLELEVAPAPPFDVSSVELPDDAQPAMRPDTPRATKASLRRVLAAVPTG
jgi:hypothetical protein